MDSLQKFESDQAQKKLVEYPLSLDSIVFDVGGYLGDWAAEIIKRGQIVCSHCGARQDPYIYVFEPVKEFYDHCVSRFSDYPKVTVFNFGLSNSVREEPFSVNGSASAPQENGNRLVVLKDITQFCYDNRIDKIDLISINIEGGEYSLLWRMITSGVIGMCRNVQVQFHGANIESENARQDIVDKLLETHDVNWSYPFVWESFRKRLTK